MDRLLAVGDQHEGDAQEGFLGRPADD
jgi:hypothetical protein